MAHYITIQYNTIAKKETWARHADSALVLESIASGFGGFLFK